ncbi:MAG: hypothetical protein SGJ18_07025 [Pseudomonadota bacterium]|nr:hypothetical protein [Pseudomonadota bacterium]
MNAHKHQTAWRTLKFGVSFLLLASTFGFTACGKKNSGGSQAQYNPLIGPANQCSGGYCYGAASGQQIANSLGRMQYDDSLDDSDRPLNNNRLMELSLKVNILQNSQGANSWGTGYMNPYNPVPSSLGGRDLLHIYSGPVQVTGSLQVLSQITGCNIPVGNFPIQPITMGSVSSSYIWQSLVANTPNGPTTIDLEGVQIVGMPARSMVNNTAVAFDSFLFGAVLIRECNNASFKME